MAQPTEAMCSMMLEVLRQKSNTSSPDTSINLLSSFIEDSTELQIFSQERNCASWIGHINGCLNSSKTRLEGLIVLRALVNQCPAEVFQQYCASWVRLLTQILQSYDPPPVIALASVALRNILKEAAQVSELSREISNTFITPIITAALELKTEWQDSAIQILAACIQSFPGPCGTFRTRTENFLIQVMGSSGSVDIAVSASQCLALLPRVGGGGQGGTKHAEAWSYYCHRVLATIKDLTDKIYHDSQPEKQSDSSHPPFTMPDAPLKEPTRMYTLVRQFKVMSACLQHMLRAEFPEMVKIPVKSILSLCVRILVPSMLFKGLKSALQTGNFSSVHSEAFNILAALLISCRGNLSLHKDIINELFVKSHAFRPSVQSDDAKYRVLSGLKLSVYGALEIWLETSGSCSGIETGADKLLEAILNDARPQAQMTKLRVTTEKPTSMNAKKSGKSKQKGETAGGETTTTSLASQQKTSPPSSSRVCLAALKVLRCLLTSIGTRVKPNFHKDVHEFVIPLLLHLQQLPPILIPAPYSNADCRRALYHVLLSSVTAPHPRWPAPLQCTAGLFSRGRQDASINVSSFCAEASIICQSIIHPRVPCLQQPFRIAQLDPKRVPSQVLSKPQASSEVDRMEISDPNFGPASMDQNTGGIVWRSRDTTAGSVEITQPAVLAATTEVEPSNKEKSEDSSDEDSDDQGIEEDDSRMEDNCQKNGDDQEQQEVIPESQEQSTVSQEALDTEDAQENASPALPVETNSVSDVILTSMGSTDVADPSKASEDRTTSPSRRSKRQRTRAQKEDRSETEDEVFRSGSAVLGSVKRRKGEDKDEERSDDGSKDKDNSGGSESKGKVDVMLASFVDSLPDQD
ncbi:proline-, glutamic acid- and leucine-rich protein 1-like [Acanthaster planci]|uniref:Proline-, glutamic acid- and leucine-rich protein 1 n=1 Tax=Acanthaster planci TaxID=133434 RepID=A0A8B7YKJ6_ACAPL|nr:proline-, glutamic acid- and leucine-rich protein 1-like [Acanthaster planci]